MPPLWGREHYKQKGRDDKDVLEKEYYYNKGGSSHRGFHKRVSSRIKKAKTGFRKKEVMWIYVILVASILMNVLLAWYLLRVLRKFFFISENISDLMLTTKAFHVFVSSLYSMDSYHGEPFIQELVERIKEVIREIERFRHIFEYTIDTELEEEFDDAQQETQGEV